MKKIITIVFFCSLLHSSILYAQVNEHLKKVEQFSNEGKYEQMFDELTTVLIDDPNNAEAYGWLGLYFINTKQNFQQALTNFLKSWDLFNSQTYKPTGQVIFTPAIVLEKIRLCHHSLKDFKKELFYVKLRAKLFPNPLDDFSALALAYRSQRMYDSAIYCCKESLKIEQRDWYTYYQLGVCSYEKKAVDMSQYYYEKAIEIGSNPQNVQVFGKLNSYVFSRLGDLKLGQGDAKAANDYYTIAISLFVEQGVRPGDGEVCAEVLTNRAIVRETQLDYEGALADLKIASQYDPLNESIPEVSIRVNKKLDAQKKLAAEAQTKIGCFEGNCKNGNGAYRFPTGDVYRGQFLNGVKQGAGVLQFAIGDNYSGTFINDSFGDGTYTKANGSVTKFSGGKQVIKQEFQNINYEDQQSVKKARKGGFWRALGDIAVGAAVVGLAALNEQEKEAKKEAASSAKNSTQPVSSTGGGSSGRCYYCFWHNNNDGISPIYEYKSASDPSGQVIGWVSKVTTDRSNPNLPTFQSESVKSVIGTRVCRTDFRIANSARDAKVEQNYYTKELKAENVTGCN